MCPSVADDLFIDKNAEKGLPPYIGGVVGDGFLSP